MLWPHFIVMSKQLIFFLCQISLQKNPTLWISSFGHTAGEKWWLINLLSEICWADASVALQCVEEHHQQENDFIQAFMLLECWNDMISKKILKAFIIHGADNGTRRTHPLKTNVRRINKAVHPHQTVTFAEWRSTSACTNEFFITHILQFCVSTKPWR